MYEAKVINPINGTVKPGNSGNSTFFPDDWTAQDIVNATNAAYNNKYLIRGNTYEGTYNNIKIRMYINPSTGKVISSYPIK